MTDSTRRASGLENVGLGTLTLYALGSSASGIKLKILGTFLLIFYNQAVGMSPALVSTAILIATIFDAVIDPLTGQFSDTLRSRWGRRHPLIYASVLPLTIAFFFLWNPPAGLGETGTFFFMLACLLVVRFCYTLFETASIALAPELVKDYDRRTTVVALRIFFRTVAGLGMTVLAFQYFLKAGPGGVGGVTDRAGYFSFAIFCSAVMFTVILTSSFATHWTIPYLSKPEPRSASPVRVARDMFAMLKNRSAFAILSVGMLTAVAGGARNGMELYFGLYFWQLSQSQLSVLATLTGGGTLLGAACVPWLSKRLGKRLAALTTYSLSFACAGFPILFRLLDIMPANGTSALFGVLAVDFFIQGGLYVMTAVLLNSMLADVVEELAVINGRRSEGLLFSADGFFSKAVSGLGVLISGVVLTMVAFPKHASPGKVGPEILWKMGAIYLPIVAVLTLLAIFMVWLFRIDRTRHEDNLRALEDTRSKPVATVLPPS